MFNVKNDGKQGSVLSLILSSAYMDELFKRFKESDIGFCIRNQYTGGNGYADDLILLVHLQKKVLQQVINICEEYAAESDVLLRL